MIAYQIKITVITNYWSISLCSCDERCRENVEPVSIDKFKTDGRGGPVNQWI